MQRKKLLSRYGLKWNPFTPEVPDDGLFTTQRIESFAMRIETMVHDGGFALITGEPGYGKSIALRIIDIIMSVERVTFLEAVRFLRQLSTDLSSPNDPQIS